MLVEVRGSLNPRQQPPLTWPSYAISVEQVDAQGDARRRGAGTTHLTVKGQERRGEAGEHLNWAEIPGILNRPLAT